MFIGSYDLGQFAQAQRWCDEGGVRFPRHYRFSECKLWLMTSDAVEPDVAEAWRLYAKLDTLTPAPSKPYEMHQAGDRKSTRLNSSHGYISYAVFCLKKKKK